MVFTLKIQVHVFKLRVLIISEFYLHSTNYIVQCGWWIRLAILSSYFQNKSCKPVVHLLQISLMQVVDGHRIHVAVYYINKAVAKLGPILINGDAPIRVFAGVNGDAFRNCIVNIRVIQGLKQCRNKLKNMNWCLKCSLHPEIAKSGLIHCNGPFNLNLHCLWEQQRQLQ